ncbi:MAG: hypothetical protein KDI51_08065 [Xanthomonadales bacterium]|nr:hypothetical protein [Xanthomonadales bacterium]
MTFMVRDDQFARHDRIRGFLTDGEPVIAVILAATDFEWTVRRAILALGTSPNFDIRAGVLFRCSGLDNYRDAWKAEVTPRFGKRLPEVLADWSGFRTSFELRHRLVHGVTGTTGHKHASASVDAVLKGSTEVADFGSANGIDLFGRLPIRRR